MTDKIELLSLRFSTNDTIWAPDFDEDEGGPDPISRWDVEVSPTGFGPDPSEYISNVRGDLIGRASVYIVDTSNCCFARRMMIEADSTASVAQILVDPDDETQIAEFPDILWGQVRGHGVIVVDHVEINPEWRGKGLGALVAALSIKRLESGCMAAFGTPPTGTWRGIANPTLSIGDVVGVDLGTKTLDEAIVALTERVRPVFFEKDQMRNVTAKEILL